jgi:nicotinamide mononucleotide transporter
VNISFFLHAFITSLQQTTWPEYVAVFAGIASVWLSAKENIWLYPIGLINTIIYIYISCSGSLFGEAAVNGYYTFMSIYGWYRWSKKDKQEHIITQIAYATTREWYSQLLFFIVAYLIVYGALVYLQQSFAPNAVPLADALASATAFTGMWLMTKKKVESWYWWMATNITSIPLYFVKNYVLTSLYYCILLIMAVIGWIEWNKKAKLYIHAA